DLKNNKDIQLSDLFPGQPDYLQKISDFSIQNLAAQMQAKIGGTDGAWIDQGANPSLENFSIFLINKDNIIFYFPEYQVAPYAAGSFQVTMPR
ncbi:MAG: RsiV family protein, partial [Candidatus Staskawiczbacteria bacterium]|nr:RsiV family protein [Candidatus Staskawiczbacteria bacterium]